MRKGKAVIGAASETPLTKNSTEAAVPSLSAAVAMMLVVLLAMMLAPAAGLVMATVGAALPVTVATTCAEVAAFPTLSIARAVRVYCPGLVGVQSVWNGKTVSAAPSGWPLTKNWTLATATSSVALATIVRVLLTTMLEPVAGLVIATVGALGLGSETVTLTPELVTWLPLSSVALAVIV